MPFSIALRHAPKMPPAEAIQTMSSAGKQWAACVNTEQCGARALLIGLKSAISNLLASVTLDSLSGDKEKLARAMGLMDKSALNT